MPLEFDGEKLNRLRTLKGLTRVELARKVESTEMSVGRWERGLATPRLKVVKRLAAVFHVSTEALYRTVENREVTA